MAGSGLVVHARTKNDGYRPPAHWEWVGRIADVVAVPVVANGECGPRTTGGAAAR
jgi:tRNA-dihydrouridine synthase C